MLSRNPATHGQIPTSSGRSDRSNFAGDEERAFPVPNKELDQGKRPGYTREREYMRLLSEYFTKGGSGPGPAKSLYSLGAEQALIKFPSKFTAISTHVGVGKSYNRKASETEAVH